SVKIIVTADGSHSLMNEDLNETYHSVHGAIQESVHVFIKNGFDHFADRWKPEQISILEIGFGTALNALLTIQRVMERSIDVSYTTLEAYPLSEELWGSLNYSETLGMKEQFKRLHYSEWEIEQVILPGFTLLKNHITLQNATFNPGSFDLVYFDAFAPGKQPELWTFPMLQKVVGAMKDNAVFVTYCAKGQLKRDLKALGLVVETLQGPPGKHEMVRGTRTSS
ncbi:MAG: methyltransferase, partial [Marivirga sp.]|nr:methyltransferase [Marivirga sp.]